MKKLAASIIVLASVASVGYAFAQDEQKSDMNQEMTDVSKDGKKGNRGPIDLQKFSNMDKLKAADTNNDGTLSREEIENFVMKRMVERQADRMQRRLDVNGDGKVTLDEIQKQKEKEFAALDRNDDGKLDRRELRAAHHKGNHGGHGKHRHHRQMHKQ
jgi:Ca2+-binding EF-hand superfamily protein